MRTVELTPRQEQVMRLLETGATNQEIADAVGMNINSLKNMLTTIYTKLGARQRTEAVYLWRQRKEATT